MQHLGVHTRYKPSSLGVHTRCLGTRPRLACGAEVGFAWSAVTAAPRRSGGVSISPAPAPKIKHKQQKKESCRVSTFPAKIQGGPSPERPTSSPQSLPRRVNWPLFPAPTAPTAGHEPRAVHSSAPNMFLQKSPTASRGSGWAARRTPWPRWDKQPCTGPCEAQRFPTPRRDSWSQAAPPESYEGPRQPLGCAPSRLLFLDNPRGRKPQAGAISAS